MNQENHRWFSHRVGREMGIRVHGHYGAPLLVFPTSGGDEWEYENQGMVAALAHHVDNGRVKLFCVNSINAESWNNRQAHPRHRSYMQAMYDSYVAFEVIPFIEDHCRTKGVAVSTAGASFGAYHALNTLLKHPEQVRRCLAQSGVYDVRRFMDEDWDENLYYNNPVEYMPNLTDEEFLAPLRHADIRLITGSGPWEDSGPSHTMAGILSAKGLPVSLDDWGADGGHDWPFWKRQMDLYIGRLF